MKHFILFALFICIIQLSVAPPVNVEEKKKDEEFAPIQDPVNIVEYNRYAREIIQVLETDLHFIKVLNDSTNEDIQSGKIAHELDYVNHHVRNRLDEIKRNEVERLRHVIREVNMQNEEHKKPSKNLEHLDHNNIQTFEKEDLKKLITQLHKDLEAYDRERKVQFKEYEMEKKYEQEQKMKGMNETDRKKYENEIHEMEEKHKKHKPLHHPGSKQQFEEVWKETDNITDQDFDPRTFFFTHDLDSNGYWDQDEVNAIFSKELDKIYEEGHPEDDLVERIEEMNLMREHFLKEADTNRDSLISYNEYLVVTKNPNFGVDPGWETIDQQKIFTPEEYKEYENRRIKEINKSIYNVPSHQMPQNQQFPHNQVPQYQQVPHNQVPQYQQVPHNQLPQYHQVPQNQLPQYQQVQHNQIPQYQQIPQNQIPQYQQVPQHQVPQYQQVPVHPGQIPQNAPPVQPQQQQQQYHPIQHQQQQHVEINHQNQVNQPQRQVNQTQGQQQAPGNQQPDHSSQQVPVKNQNSDTVHLQNSIPNVK
ncbi:nucleobindin-2 isoform X2 [Leptopilina boulardi]|uniref:nucleobindin-2 isoform X2 n=1 Tax=Leptopilina boulardi TaxID=63433 RepID=UPI0021F63463|nr:nucleobindin-2 isoform X2 [Leptopilina boulardi]